MRTLAAVLLFTIALPLAAQVAEGDRHLALRAEGSSNGHAKGEHVNAAIAAYQRAIASNANDLEARWKLLRAIRFKGAYVATSNDEKKQIYAGAKKAGDEALVVIDRLLAAKGLKGSARAGEKQVAAVARNVPGAGETYLWDAVNWGEWALAYGKMAAAREGAADRIRRGATIAYLINPALEGGAPPRVLGRLHDQTPRIPFITGWASQKEAVRFLRESLQADPTNKLTLLFLAEAMVSENSASKPQALQLLRKAGTLPNQPEFLVEQEAAGIEAAAVLRKWEEK